MTRTGLRYTASLCMMISFAIAAAAAITDTPERWNTGSAEGWVGVDALNGGPCDVHNNGNYLELTFASQPNISMGGFYRMYADSSSSQGRFIGNLTAAGVKGVSFKLYCANTLPGMDIQIEFHSQGSNHLWFQRLHGVQVGQWVLFSVPLSYSAGWAQYVPHSETDFNADIQDVDWIGFSVLRKGSSQQSYGIDDFVLASSSYDSDGDGQPDFSEYQSKTDPANSSSVFKVTVTRSASGDGFIISWPSSPTLAYDLWRSTSIGSGFGAVPLASVPGALSAESTSYEDLDVAGAAAYFYRVTVQDSK